MRWLIMDEIEAAGCNMIADIDSTTQQSAGKLFKYGGDDATPRVFGGLNVLLMGDFWQLPPTGQIAVMSNPFSQKVLESARANSVMSMFWRSDSKYSLQHWNDARHRVMHLQVNKRSGGDAWFSKLLDDCRLGRMTLDDYNFLHGFPTEEPACEQCKVVYQSRIQTHAAITNRDWADVWGAIKEQECDYCKRERARRRRVLGCEEVGGLSTEEAQALLSDERFWDGLFITECNKPVTLYAL